MSRNSKIEWTEDTWNPVTGCSRVSAGCDHCFAARISHRFAHTKAYEGLTVLNGNGYRHFNGTVRLLPERLADPIKRKRPTTWFVNSMSDPFHEKVPFEFIDKVMAVMAFTPRHTYQVLTKRPQRMEEYLSTRARSSKFIESAGAELGAIDPRPVQGGWRAVLYEADDRQGPHTR